MSARDVLRFALGSLLGHRLRSSAIALAMAVGVASVVVLVWLGDSARRYVVGEFESLGTDLLIVLPGKSETAGGAPPLLGQTPRDLTIDDALALERSPWVHRVTPIVVGNAPVSHGSLDREASILGSTPELIAIRRLALDSGRIWPSGDPRRSSPVCILGATIAGELFGGRSPIGEWVRIGDRRFRVLGVIASRGRSLGQDLEEIVVVPVAAAQALFDSPGLFRVIVQATSRDAIAQAQADVVRILAGRHEGEEDVTVITQESVLATFDRILRALTLSIGGIASVSLVVAGVLVMNVMVIAVAQRREEIGLLKALGAAPATIRRVFLVEAALVSVGGAAAGIAFGELTARVVPLFYPLLAPGAPWWGCTAAVAVALIAALVFGVTPARRAADLDPVEALSRR